MMDMLSLVRSMGALGCVLGVLAAALWIVRRYDLALPGRVGVLRDKRLAVVERVQLDPRRALVLVRRDDREHLCVLMPDRVAVLEQNIASAFTLQPAIATAPRLCPSLDADWYDADWQDD